MILKDIIKIIENVCPKTIAEQWDNVGLMLGDENMDITKAMVTLDVTYDVVMQAIDSKCQLIISHHPLFFEGIKSLEYTKPMGRLIKALIENNICVYSAHTNMDAARNGINDMLADIFQMENICAIEQNADDSNIGLGRIGDIKNPMTIDELCSLAKSRLETPFVRLVCKDSNLSVRTLAVGSGSSADLIALAKQKGADAIITGDVKYHQALDALDMGISVIDAGHFPTEKIVMDIFEDILSKTGIEMQKAKIRDCFIVK